MKVNLKESDAAGSLLNLAEAAANNAESVQEFKVWAQQLWPDVAITERENYLVVYPFGLTQGTYIRIDVVHQSQEAA